MKSLILSIILLAATLTGYSQSETKKVVVEKIKVSGSCEMCQETIETAALSNKGVKQAKWNANEQLLTVVYAPKKTDLKTIEESIAAKGYDTENIKGSNEAYNKLPRCCAYRPAKPETK